VSLKHWPRAKTASLGNFVRSWDDSRHRDSKERVVVFNWGPILLVFPRDLEGWK
jgi:hypothetical protein